MISECRSCKSKWLEKIISLGEMYLVDFLEGDEKPAKYPLDLVLCKDCSLLQLGHTTPTSSLYTDRYGYRSGTNQTMRRHLSQIVQKVEGLVSLTPTDIVVDIGCNDGTLLKAYGASAFTKVGFDPVKKFARDIDGTRIRFVGDYFTKERYKDIYDERKAMVITAISMFYDLDEPNKFVSDVAMVLDDDGVFIVQQNYLASMLQNNAFDNIVHEHIEFYSLLSLENLLERHRLMVFDVKLNDLNGGSFRTYICHMGSREASEEVLDLREAEAKLGLQDVLVYRGFASRIEAIRDKLYNLIEGLVRDGKTVYLYGASTRGNTLLQYCGLDNRLITAASERNPEKWGKKFASVGVPMISEEQAREDNPDYCLVLPWFFREEFLKREVEYLKQGGKFIFPLPEVEVVG